MRQTILHLYARSPARSARLLSPGATSSCHTPCPSFLTFQRRLQHQHQHRAFHITPIHHRRPPPIRVAKTQPPPPQPKPKPQAQPKTTTTTTPAQPSPPQPSSSSNNNQNPPKSKFRYRNELLFLLAALAIFTPTLTLTSTTNPKAHRPLNTETFAPFTVTAREDVSQTAFILTVVPSAAAAAAVAAGGGEGGEGVGKGSATVAWLGKKAGGGGGEEVVGRTGEEVKRAWRAGLWALEVKQPELMVARDYTPLPEEGEVGVVDGDGEGGKLRLYVRRMERGEVSNYLARMKVGDEVELRGPKLGFDLRARVGVEDRGEAEGENFGERKKVVFLAGGTGISPALQAAKALLDNPRVEMEVVWANRRREDCVGCDGGEQRGAVVAMLEEFRSKYEGRFKYSCTVDREGTFIDAGTIARVTQPTPSPSAPALALTKGQSAWELWPSRGTSQKSIAISQPASTVNSDACSYHSSKELVVSDESDPHAGADSRPCQCKDINGSPVRGGKNLLMVSGPEGFVKHLAGAKVWGAGKEMQGPVKGVIGDLTKQNPSLGEDWLVLKM